MRGDRPTRPRASWPSPSCRPRALLGTDTSSSLLTLRRDEPAHSSCLRSGNVTCADASLLLDDEGGDHAEHAVLALRVVEDVAVEGPDSRLGRLDDRLEALTRRDVER